MEEYPEIAATAWNWQCITATGQRANPSRSREIIGKLFRSIEFLGNIGTRTVGIGLTWLLLVPVFYAFFLPVRLILQMLGKDPMRRCWEKDRGSYWLDRLETHDLRRYRRQY